MSNLVGKNILIVDEVDDTRTTLEYAVRELEKDVEEARQKLGREGETTRFSVFVLHVSTIIGLPPEAVAAKATIRTLAKAIPEQGQTEKGTSTTRHDG